MEDQTDSENQQCTAGCHLEVTGPDIANDAVLREAGVIRPAVGDIGLMLKTDGAYSIEWRELDDDDDAPLRTFEIDEYEAAQLLLRFWIPEPFVALFSPALEILRTKTATKTFKDIGEYAPPGPISQALATVTKWLEDEERKFSCCETSSGAAPLFLQVVR